MLLFFYTLAYNDNIDMTHRFTAAGGGIGVHFTKNAPNFFAITFLILRTNAPVRGFPAAVFEII